MNAEYAVSVLRDSGGAFDATLIFTSTGKCGVEVRAEGLEIGVHDAEDVPRLVARLLEECQKQGVTLLVNASRPNVRWSAMAAQGGGPKAYVVDGTRRPMLVDLFEPATHEEIAGPAARERGAAWDDKVRTPDFAQGLITTAKSIDHGWAWRVGDEFHASERFPRDKDPVGAWRVGPGGELTGEYFTSDPDRPTR